MTHSNRRQRLGHRLTPWGFPLLYLGWAYLFWLPIFGSNTSVWEGTNLILFLAGGTVSAVTCSPSAVTGHSVGPSRCRLVRVGSSFAGRQ
jgi:hypothetical protein